MHFQTYKSSIPYKIIFFLLLNLLIYFENDKCVIYKIFRKLREV